MAKEQLKGKLLLISLNEKDIKGGTIVVYDDKFWYLEPQTATLSNLSPFAHHSETIKGIDNGNIRKMAVKDSDEFGEFLIDLIVTQANFRFLLNANVMGAEIEGYIKAKYYYQNETMAKPLWASDEISRENAIRMSGKQHKTWESRFLKPLLNVKIEEDDVLMYLFRIYEAGKAAVITDKSSYPQFLDKITEYRKDRVFDQIIYQMIKTHLDRREMDSMSDQEISHICDLLHKTIGKTKRFTNSVELIFDDDSRLNIKNNGTMTYSEMSQNGDFMAKRGIPCAIQISKYLLERHFF